jgi:hypothetical protein
MREFWCGGVVVGLLLSTFLVPVFVDFVSLVYGFFKFTVRETSSGQF